MIVAVFVSDRNTTDNEDDNPSGLGWDLGSVATEPPDEGVTFSPLLRLQRVRADHGFDPSPWAILASGAFYV